MKKLMLVLTSVFAGGLIALISTATVSNAQEADRWCAAVRGLECNWSTYEQCRANFSVSGGGGGGSCFENPKYKNKN